VQSICVQEIIVRTAKHILASQLRAGTFKPIPVV
jgi:hypothetical protein